MVHPTRNVKQQFLDCVRLLQEKKVINIERAKMLLVIVLVSLEGDDDFSKRRDATVGLLTEVGVESEHIKPAVEKNDPRVTFKSDPSLYRQLEAIAKDPVIKGRLEIIQQCVTDEYDVTLGSDLVQPRDQKSQPGATEKKPTVCISDDVDASLSEELKSNLNVVDKSSSPIQEAQSTNVNSRKAQKAAQKKSKKAKRREKEEQAEREERINAEKERQKARADRLGLAEDDNNKHGSAESASGQGSDTKPCNTCGGNFTHGEYRAHFRSDWHRFNVKLKMKAMPPVSEKEFLLCDADEFF